MKKPILVPLMLSLLIAILSIPQAVVCEDVPFTLGLWGIWLGDPFPGYLSESEKQKMLDIGTNYLIACMCPHESVYIDFCNATEGAITMDIEGDCDLEHERLWSYICYTPSPDTAVITQFVQCIYDEFGSSAGFGSYLIMHETEIVNPAKNYAMQYACQQIHNLDPNDNHKTVVVNGIGGVLASNPNFFEEVPDLDIFEHEHYAFNYDTPYEGEAFQQTLDGLINTYQTSIAMADSHDFEWHAIIQTYANGDPPDSGRRFPTREEINCQAYLAISRGAKGVLCFCYGSDTVGTDEHLYGILTTDRNIAHYVSRPGNTDPYEDIQDLYNKLQPITSFLNELIWRGACRSDTAGNPSFSFIDSLKSTEYDTSYVEVGFFEDSVGTDYFMLVNRRCLSYEDQNLTAYIDKDSVWLVIDVCANDTTLGVPMKWQGGLLASGDVKVDSGRTLTIFRPAEIKFTNYSDCESSGVSTNRCEIIVNGSLRVDRGGGGWVKFIPEEAQGQSPWWGVRVGSDSYPNASLFLDSVEIRRAYCGVDYQSSAPHDTIRNSIFKWCKIYGIRCKGDSLVIHDNSFITSSVMYGIYCDSSSSAKIWGNEFYELNYGIYVNNSLPKLHKDFTCSDTNYFSGSSYGIHVESSGDSRDNLVEIRCQDMGDGMTESYISSDNSFILVESCNLRGDTAWLPADTYVGVFASGGGDSIWIRATHIHGYYSAGVRAENNVWINMGRRRDDQPYEAGWNCAFSCDTSAYNVYNDNQDTCVWARKNWWGSDSPNSELFHRINTLYWEISGLIKRPIGSS